MSIKMFRKRVNKVNAFENAKTEEHEIHYFRYIASWLMAGGTFTYLRDVLDFKEWLRSMNLSEDEVQAIANMAACGKLELESSARAFLKGLEI